MLNLLILFNLLIGKFDETSLLLTLKKSSILFLLSLKSLILLIISLFSILELFILLKDLIDSFLLQVLNLLLETLKNLDLFLGL